MGGGAAEKPPCLQQDRPQDLLVDRFLDEKMALARVGDRSLALRRDKTMFILYIYIYIELLDIYNYVYNIHIYTYIYIYIYLNICLFYCPFFMRQSRNANNGVVISCIGVSMH